MASLVDLDALSGQHGFALDNDLAAPQRCHAGGELFIKPRKRQLRAPRHTVSDKFVSPRIAKRERAPGIGRHDRKGTNNRAGTSCVGCRAAGNSPRSASTRGRAAARRLGHVGHSHPRRPPANVRHSRF